ncbi:MAG: tetratricopeptide repeat protein [Candidatus Omnitrophota bacterium]|nr:tetratricopeptide repeat protein [Candidatus Omnitrophota bacterium]MDZ4241530.1 tetratricopeptide repeat protein [Candidatus Omnitrophota bacterium]
MTANSLKKLVTNPWLMVPLILAGALVVFAPSLQNGFVNWDDPEVLLENPLIRGLSPDHLRLMFTTHLTGKYHPLALLSFALEYQFSPLSPAVAHGINLALHLLNTILVYYFVRGLALRPALALVITVLFAVHPLHVEPVAWAASRKDALFAFFYLLGLLAYQKGLALPSRRPAFLILTFAAFACSLLSKATAVSLPVVLLLLDRYENGKISREDVLWKLPHFVIVVLYIIGVRAAAGGADAFPATALNPPLMKILLSGQALLIYFVKILVPVNLSAFYPLPEYANPGLFLSPLAVLGTGFVLYRRFRTHPLLSFAILFFVVTIAPTLHLAEINDSVVYDRFAYLPSLGIFLVMAVALERLWTAWPRKRVLLACAVAAYVLVLSAASFTRCGVWKDSETLWKDVLAMHPGSAVAHLNLGSHYDAIGRYPEAVFHFDRAVALAPNFAMAYFNKGNVMARDGLYQPAISYYNKALEFDKNYIDAYINRGNMFLLSGQAGLALKDYDTALTLNPYHVPARLNRGMCFIAQKDYAKALAEFDAVLKLDSANALALEKKRALEKKLNPP